MLSEPGHSHLQSRNPKEARRGAAKGSRWISGPSKSWRNKPVRGGVASLSVLKMYPALSLSKMSISLILLVFRVSAIYPNYEDPLSHSLILMHIKYITDALMSLLKLGNLFFLLASWGITTHM